MVNPRVPNFKKTKARKSDPYRFSSYQYRFLILSAEQQSRLMKCIEEVGFKKESQDESEKWMTVVFKGQILNDRSTLRDQIVSFLSDKKRPEHVVLESHSHAPWRRYHHIDADNQTFDLLEKMIEKSNLKTTLCTSEWKRIG